MFLSFSMTVFIKYVVFASTLIAALGWLADGGSVSSDAAQMLVGFFVL